MSYIMGFDPSETTEDQKFALGTLAQDYNGDWYQYVQADGDGFSSGDAVIIDESNEADAVDTTNSAAGTGQGLPVGVPTVDFAADEYGWVKRYGQVTDLNVATDAAAHTELNTTGTAGRLDDNASGAEVVDGITTTAAEASNAAAAILLWPKVGRVLA